MRFLCTSTQVGCHIKSLGMAKNGFWKLFQYIDYHHLSRRAIAGDVPSQIAVCFSQEVYVFNVVSDTHGNFSLSRLAFYHEFDRMLQPACIPAILDTCSLAHVSCQNRFFFFQPSKHFECRDFLTNFPEVAEWLTQWRREQEVRVAGGRV